MNFEETVTVGNILTILLLVGGFITTWVRRSVSDAQRVMKLDALSEKITTLENRIITHDAIVLQLSALQVKVDTMWQFQIRRGVSEVVHQGAGTMNSPLEIFEKYRSALDPIKGELVRFWKDRGHSVNDCDAMLEIERLFGAQLFEKVCIPCGMSHAGCLIVALSVASERTSFNINI